MPWYKCIIYFFEIKNTNNFLFPFLLSQLKSANCTRFMRKIYRCEWSFKMYFMVKTVQFENGGYILNRLCSFVNTDIQKCNIHFNTNTPLKTMVKCLTNVHKKNQQKIHELNLSITKIQKQLEIVTCFCIWKKKCFRRSNKPQ